MSVRASFKVGILLPKMWAYALLSRSEAHASCDPTIKHDRDHRGVHGRRSPELLQLLTRRAMAERSAAAGAEGREAKASGEGAAYVGLRGGETSRVTIDSGGVLVKPDVAARQMEAQRPPEQPPIEGGEHDSSRRRDAGLIPPAEAPRAVMRRFHGSVSLDPDRLGRDAGRIAEEIVQHLSTQKTRR